MRCAAEAIVSSSALIDDQDTAIVVVDHGSRDPDSNAEVAKAAQLLWEDRSYGWVEPAFHSLTSPNLIESVERYVTLGMRRVVVLPYVLFAGRINRLVSEQVHQLQQRFPKVEILIGGHLGCHVGVVEAVAQRYQEAVSGTATITSALYGQRINHNHGGGAHSHGAWATTSMLPPRYQSNVAVSAAPMQAAALVYDAEGHVAWDQVWGGDDPQSPFCELALAGGLPHRSELLEPVMSESVHADPDSYTRVLTELQRGIRMTTGLISMASQSPGWIGVSCHSEDMAIWLLRAIVVENVSVRREGNVLFLPAGPQFRLEYETKNVSTALVKTHHYWQEHLSAAQ